MKCDYNNKLTTDVDMDYAEKGCDIDDFNKVYNDYMQAELQSVCETIGMITNLLFLSQSF